MSGLKVQNIFIVDDHELVRQGLRQLVDGEADMHICGEAANVYDALNMRSTLTADVAIVDLSLPDGNGLDLIKQLHAWRPQMGIIVLSMHDDELYAERALNCGALGYINKQDSAQKLLLGIRQVMKNKIFVKAEILEKIRKNPSRTITSKNAINIQMLTDRELQVFEAIGQGITTTKIAKLLNVSVKTIESHRRHIKDKFHLSSGLELTRSAIIWSLEVISAE
ncbi:response regulator transcription factor [Colwellia sp. MB02u-10]|uniref:response regulator n=1 Tax=Colwellia sp. MB02u-10 TaxID=2759828 RepID=UPI0015F73421|nr:response regulator transcription factor [Colwellia sp. MB02u-10]MBA6341758.1 response regulator transcription factor [Colwellia sp. MB02u-10]